MSLLSDRHQSVKSHTLDECHRDVSVDVMPIMPPMKLTVAISFHERASLGK